MALLATIMISMTLPIPNHFKQSYYLFISQTHYRYLMALKSAVL